MKKFLSFFIGFLNGLFGAGGGAVLVPFLNNKFNLNQKKSHGTSILIILLLSIVSTVTFFSETSVVLKEVFYLGLGGALGGFISGKLLNKIQNKTLSLAFSILLIFVGGRILFW